MPNRVYLVDMGYLLKEGSPRFMDYSDVYDHKYGYFDTKQQYSVLTEGAVKEKARECAKLLLENFENLNQAEPGQWAGCYCVVLNAGYEDDYDEDMSIEEQDVDYDEYIVDNIVYSVAYIDGKLVEDFIQY